MAQAASDELGDAIAALETEGPAGLLATNRPAYSMPIWINPHADNVGAIRQTDLAAIGKRDLPVEHSVFSAAVHTKHKGDIAAFRGRAH